MRRFEDLRKVWLSGWERQYLCFRDRDPNILAWEKEFYEQIPICKEVYDLASEVTGLDIPALCFEENEKINITEYTQICMLATEAAIYMALEQNGYQPDVTAGLSLGEYGALIASGVMTAEEAFELVRKRGIFMQEAVPAGGARQQC